MSLTLTVNFASQDQDVLYYYIISSHSFILWLVSWLRLLSGISSDIVFLEAVTHVCFTSKFCSQISMHVVFVCMCVYCVCDTDPQRGMRERKQEFKCCLLYTFPSPRDSLRSRMPSSA